MTTQPKPGRITTSPNGRPVIAGPWPSYRQFRDLPERKCGFHADSDTHSTRIRTVIPR
ncbi:hypothetical protein ACT01K_22000 [Pseudomonas aeruginosa]|uniref:hypothetical protein n=1 Tax=Pseudomonas aeruginosa TaxID=287 RepID=UPI00402B8774